MQSSIWHNELFLLLWCWPLIANAQTKGLADLANHRVVPNDTLQIEIALAELRQGLQLQNPEITLHGFADDFEETGIVKGRNAAKNFLAAYFAAAMSRGNPLNNPNLTTTWDFDITGVRIQKTGAVFQVDCNLVFHQLALDSTTAGLAQATEKLIFQKQGELWMLKNSGQLFKFLPNILPTTSRQKFTNKPATAKVSKDPVHR